MLGKRDLLKMMVKERLKKDPVKFAEVVVGIKPFPYQRRFLRDTSKRILFVGGRQIGKSTIVALKALWKAWCFSSQVILIVAPTLRQSKITFNKIRQMILGSKILRNDAVKITLNEIEFENGSKIHCLPSGRAGETIRGFTADMVIVDEGALVPDEVFVAIMPSLAVRNGDMIVLGSPMGKDGFFWKAWNSSGWSKHHVPATESPLVDEEFIEEYRRTHTEVEFRREILAEFTEQSDIFFPMDTVRQVATGKRWSGRKEGYIYFAGLDVARFGSDETVLVILVYDEKSEIPFTMATYYTRAQSSISETIGWAKRYIYEWDIKKIFIDETGLGAGVVDILREQLGDRIQGVIFSPQNRVEMYSTLRQTIMDRKIILLDDPKLMTQFENYSVSYTSTGGIRIKKKQTGRDDIVDALALAVYGATQYATSGVEVVPEVAKYVELIGKIGELGNEQEGGKYIFE